DFGSHEAKPGDTVHVSVTVKTGHNPVAAMDVVFAQDSPLKLVAVGGTSEAFGKAQVSPNMDLPGCSFTCGGANGEGIFADENKAVFELTYEIPQDCPGGEYHIGFGSKCSVFNDNTEWTYKTAQTGGVIKVTATEKPKFALGDVNNDGTVDGSDATIVLREFGNVLAGKGASFTPEQFEAGDVDRNGTIDGSDATLILKFFGLAVDNKELSYGGMEPWMEKNFWNKKS
ncbi:MAG: hypothetical protein GXY08_14960, partial [Ruminococcus sp.]|nr:hypothetical protein [Ruminococcus sp.]